MVGVAETAESELRASLREFLVWVERCPRTYAETMEAWRSSCPRFTIWEDALAEGLVQIDRDSVVTLTRRGLTALGRR